MNLEQAKKLEYRNILHLTENESKWKVNGKVQTWKKDPSRIRIPLKHGLY